MQIMIDTATETPQALAALVRFLQEIRGPLELSTPQLPLPLQLIGASTATSQQPTASAALPAAPSPGAAAPAFTPSIPPAPSFPSLPPAPTGAYPTIPAGSPPVPPAPAPGNVLQFPAAGTAGASSLPPASADSTAASTVTTSPSEPPPLFDADGLPWDERIHSGNRKLTNAKKWWGRKGVNDLVVKQVEAELRAKLAQGWVPTPPTAPAPTPPPAAPSAAGVQIPPPPPAPPIPAAPQVAAQLPPFPGAAPQVQLPAAAPTMPAQPVVSVPAVPAPPSPPVGNPQDFINFMIRFNQMVAAGRVGNDRLPQILSEAGCASSAELNQNLDRVPLANAVLDRMLSTGQ